MASLHHDTPTSNASDSSSSEEPDHVNLAPDNEWQDVESDAEQLQVVSLLDHKTFKNAQDMLNHCKTQYSFDFVKLVRDLDLEFYECIKLVNYIRSQVKDGTNPPDVSSKTVFEDDKYLQPVLEDDALLFGLDDVLDSPLVAEAGDNKSSTLINGANDSSKEQAASSTHVKELEQQLSRLQSEFSDYRAAVAQTLDQRWNNREDNTAKKESAQDDDTHYFESYANNGIHETMLRDTTRTSSYMNFIYNNKPLFANSTVLDIGCGTSILSLFCARAGNSQTRIYAIDASDIISRAKEIVQINGLADRITCIKANIEQPIPELSHLSSPPTNTTTTNASPATTPKKADILISEWMGYTLLYESMLPSLLHARDTYLDPSTGLICPSHTTLHIAPVSDPDYTAETLGFWTDVYGFDMRCMLTDEATLDAAVRRIEPHQLLGQSCRFKTLDLYTTQKEDLWFTAPFSVTISPSSSSSSSTTTTTTSDPDPTLTGFAIWFDTFFIPSRNTSLPPSARAESYGTKPSPRTPSDDGTRVAEDGSVAFTTGPHGPDTHWQMGYLAIDKRRRKKRDDEGQGEVVMKEGMVVSGAVEYRKRGEGMSGRELEIWVKWSVDGTRERGVQRWLMR